MAIIRPDLSKTVLYSQTSRVRTRFWRLFLTLSGCVQSAPLDAVSPGAPLPGSAPTTSSRLEGWKIQVANFQLSGGEKIMSHLRTDYVWDYKISFFNVAFTNHSTVYHCMSCHKPRHTLNYLRINFTELGNLLTFFNWD